MIPTFPGPRGHYLRGHREEYDADPLGFLLSQYQEFGRIFRFRRDFQAIIVLSELEWAQTILNDQERFADKGGGPRIQAAYTHSVARIEGAAHVARRRLLAPAFTWDAVFAHSADLQQCCIDGMRDWPLTLEESSFSAQGALKKLATRCLLRSMLGAAELPPEQELRMARALPVIEAWLARQEMPEAEYQHAAAELASVLQQRGAARSACPLQGAPDLLQVLAGHLAQAQQAPDSQFAIDEVAMMLMTAIPCVTLILWLCYYLARDTALQTRAREELQTHLAQGRDLHKLPLLQHLVQESLRLQPPVWTLARVAREDVACGPYQIKAGSEVMISPYLIQRDAEWWPEAESFAPERYVPGHALHRERPRLAWLPFGAGSRKCIGERLCRSILLNISAQLLLQFSWRLPPGYQAAPRGKRPLRPGDGVAEHMQMLWRRL